MTGMTSSTMDMIVSDRDHTHTHTHSLSLPLSLLLSLSLSLSLSLIDTHMHTLLCTHTHTDVGQCKALFDYTANQEDELSIQPGDVINIIEKYDAEWWQGEIDGDVGIFPASYVEDI